MLIRRQGESLLEAAGLHIHSFARKKSASSSLAKERIGSLEALLKQCADVLSQEYAEVPALLRREPERTASNTYDVEYILRGFRERNLSLRFIVTGPAADLILFQTAEKRADRDEPGTPAEVDQHVYKPDEIELLKELVQDKILSHLLF